MKKKITRALSIALTSGLILTSCSIENEAITPEAELNTVSAKASISSIFEGVTPPKLKNNVQLDAFDYAPLNLNNVVTPSECGPTPFNSVISASVQSNLDALGSEWYDLYAQMNFFYTITDESKQYFGDEGQYTNYMKKVTRSLEKFWNTPNEISVRGQHNGTLDDKQKIIDILNFWYVVEPGEPEFLADLFVDVINVESTFLIETPLLSFDGFAIALEGQLGQGDLIVIGDGLVELASEAGVQDKVVWAGIMAHEWGHQLQFNNRGIWTYPGVDLGDEAEDTRSTELEADFFTGYYLTHKRGGTYNWKGVNGFLDLFFNIGDCGFTNPGHHGTPTQRLDAAYQGYLMAQNEQKKGKISSAQKVHDTFISKLDVIIGNNTVSSEVTNIQ